MARPTYRITQKDYGTAYNYIENAMNRGEIGSTHGYMKFRNADTPEKLHAWCEDYLDLVQWRKLKNIIWVTRKRVKDYKSHKQKKQVDLDYQAWVRLKSRAEENGLSLSDMVLKMDEIMDKARDVGIR